MSIRPGMPADLPQIRYLLRSSHRSYLNCGYEDLPDLLQAGMTAVGEDEQRQLWGFAAFQREQRPITMPPDAPTRMNLRAAVVQRNIFSERRLPALFTHMLDRLRTDRGDSGCHPLRLASLSSHGWLISVLKQVGFEEVDQIRFYVRTQRDVPAVAQPARLRPLRIEEIDHLAQLDSETFDPLWHMGRTDLLQFCFTARLQVAEYQDRIVGYTITAIHKRESLFDEGGAQIVRIAVHPSAQHKGIGRQLLADAIQYAQEAGVYRVQLNTQESNRASQRLYESFAFRHRGQNIPVLTLMLVSEQTSQLY